MMRKLRRHGDGVRKKMSVYLYPEQSRKLEAIAKQKASSSSAVIAEMIHDSIEANGDVEAPLSQVERLIALILNRLSKLERIQRTLVLNTAYSRGYAIGSTRAAPADFRKSIEQEMAKFYEKQRELFFDLYPEQREGEMQEVRS